MVNKRFKDESQKARQYVNEGLDHLVEIAQLLEEVDLTPTSGDKEKIIRSIIAKEKQAVSLIQESTMIQRELMRTQHDEVARLLESI